jgi:hypothetical protein
MRRLTYRKCPLHREAKVTNVSNDLRNGVAIFECDEGHLYSTITAKNGLLLETRVRIRAGHRRTFPPRSS